MFVKNLFADNWINRADHGVAVESPIWNQVEQAIHDLDGQQRTLLTIADKEGGDHFMLIAGQWEGCFIVNATKNNFDFFSLVAPGRSANKCLLTIGGQSGEYEERKCVPLHWALVAAKYFCEFGELDTSLNWVSDY